MFIYDFFIKLGKLGGEILANFKVNTRSRSWFVTVQITNMEQMGLIEEKYKNPEFLAEFLVNLWSQSGINRTAGATVCISASGLYHAHMALYGTLTTLKRVADIYYGSHVEPLLGGKNQLLCYLKKEPPFSEKGEIVLYSYGLENIQEKQGRRSDIEEIAELIQQGFTPSQIMQENFVYRKFEKMIRSAFLDKRLKETPLLKENKNCVWVVGESGTGKSYKYYQMAEEFGAENIYLANDLKNGGLDFYIEQGAPPILFIDEFKGEMPFSQLLTILDKFSRAQVHCRYTNCFCLWETVVITSVFPPDEIYDMMIESNKQNRDKIKQLIRRLNFIEYRYIENGEFKVFSIPASEYINYNDLIDRATTEARSVI